MVLTGLRAWVVQRITAVYLAGYLLYAVAAAVLEPPAGFTAWRDWMTAPAMAVATGLAFLALLYHAWIGIRDVVLDYVHPLPARGILLGLVLLALVAQGLWALLILVGAAA